MNALLRIAALTLVVAAGTLFLNWAAVPIIAAVYALLRRAPRATGEAAVSAALAWLLLIGRQATMPAFGKLLSTLGGIFPAPGIVLIGVSLLLAAILAACAARLSLGLFGIRSSPSA
jgi:uncharacterized membrane protein